jgi:hypothetical protein
LHPKSFYSFAICLFISCLIPIFALANTVRGKVSTTKGEILPFASILIKGTTRGTTGNSKGEYSLKLNEGSYVLICQRIGYKTIEKKIKVVLLEMEVNFEMEEQQYELKEVVVSNKAEDPAYEIIRNAIKAKEINAKALDNFKCQVYLKGQIALNDYPKMFMGDSVDFEDGDTSKAKILFLSETIAEYSISEKQKKVEVISTKVSGRSDGFGLGSPNIISFYQNTISVSSAFNPRGFISPIADNALNYYKYKYMGSFYENGLEICRIKVMPKRKQEPLFTGYMNIIEGRWVIQGVQLQLLQEQQLQLIDTLSYTQTYMPIGEHWMVKQQVANLSGKFFGFGFAGTILQVYDQYETQKKFDKKYFTNTIIKYLDSSNRKSINYWDSIRPIPLLANEAADYLKKDSLELLRKDPAYLDSIDIIRNKFRPNKLLLSGYSYSKQRNKLNLKFDPLLYLFPINFNPAEGKVMQYKITYNKGFGERSNLRITPAIRYGIEKGELYYSINNSFSFPSKLRNSLNMGFGNTVFQFNNDNPIPENANTFNAYLWGRNLMKTYEAKFFTIGYRKELGHGVDIALDLQYQNRSPLDNVIDSLRGMIFTPNYSTDLMNGNIQTHKALLFTVNLQWTPKSKYLELPNRLIKLGSTYPTFNFNIETGLRNSLGSDVDFIKWKASAAKNFNFKIYGRLNAKIVIGGFLNGNKVFEPDYQHYNTSRIALAGNYMNAFQLLPYYKYSNTASFYTESHFEYHLNGFLSNKIPLFKKLNWFFVIGANTLNVNSQVNYYETFFSVENIFKIARIDFVNGYLHKGPSTNGVKFTLNLFR